MSLRYTCAALNKSRLEAFSDGVIAIIITIMVLELKVPHHPDFAALRELAPVLLSYVLSFIYVGIYWNNHHHMLQAVHKISGAALWANLHLLFWLSLIPFASGWMGENHFATIPVALYGFCLLMCAVAYAILANILVKIEGPNSKLAMAINRDFKGKISIAIYLLAIALTFVNHWLGFALYCVVAAIWLIPDSRIERQTTN